MNIRGVNSLLLLFFSTIQSLVFTACEVDKVVAIRFDDFADSATLRFGTEIRNTHEMPSSFWNNHVCFSHYVLTDIGVPSSEHEQNVVGLQLTNANDVCGYHNEVSFFYSKNEFTIIDNYPIDSNFVGGYTRACNNKGEIVGDGVTHLLHDGNNAKAFIWSEDRGMRELFPGDKSNSWAKGINTAGSVVGYYTETWNSSERIVAFIWDEQNGPILLGLLNYNQIDAYSHANDINDDGVVVGTATGFDNSPKPFKWTKNKGFEILQGVENTSGSANHINDSGQIAGIIHTNNSLSHDGRPILWDTDGTVIQLGIPAVPSYLNSAEAIGLNNHGVVVGTSSSHTENNKKTHGWIWCEGKITNLNNILIKEDGRPLNDEWHIHHAYDVSDSGIILAQAVNLDGYERAVMLTPQNKKDPE